MAHVSLVPASAPVHGVPVAAKVGGNAQVGYVRLTEAGFETERRAGVSSWVSGAAATVAGVAFGTVMSRRRNAQRVARKGTTTTTTVTTIETTTITKPEKKDPAKPGDVIPDVSLHKGFPPDMVNLRTFCKGKKLVLMGLPAAFTPTWSTKNVPGFLKAEAELKAKGVTEVLVYCVNDAAVMDGWQKSLGVDSPFMTFMGDPHRELTDALGMVMDHEGPVGVLGNARCKRFTMLVEDGVIKTVNVAEGEGDPAGDSDPSASLAEKMLQDLC